MCCSEKSRQKNTSDPSLKEEWSLDPPSPSLLLQHPTQAPRGGSQDPPRRVEAEKTGRAALGAVGEVPGAFLLLRLEVWRRAQAGLSVQGLALSFSGARPRGATQGGGPATHRWGGPADVGPALLEPGQLALECWCGPGDCLPLLGWGASRPPPSCHGLRASTPSASRGPRTIFNSAGLPMLEVDRPWGAGGGQERRPNSCLSAPTFPGSRLSGG